MSIDFSKYATDAYYKEMAFNVVPAVATADLKTALTLPGNELTTNAIKMLIAAKANPAAPGLFSYAIGNCDLAIVQLLINSKANVNQIADGETPLTQLLCKKSPFIAQRTERAISILLGAKANLDGRNLSGQTPLMVAAAAKRCSVQMFQFILNLNPNPYLTDNFGKTAFSYAISPSIDGSSKLTKVKALIGKKTKEEMPVEKIQLFSLALFDAINANSIQCIELLLKAKADVDYSNGRGETALTLALRNTNPCIMALIEQSTAKAQEDKVKQQSKKRKQERAIKPVNTKKCASISAQQKSESPGSKIDLGRQASASDNEVVDIAN